MANDLTTSAQALDKTISTIVMNGNTYTPDEMGKVDVGEISSGGSDIDYASLPEDYRNVLGTVFGGSGLYGFDLPIFGVKEDLSNLPDNMYLIYSTLITQYSSFPSDFSLDKMFNKVPELIRDKDEFYYGIKITKDQVKTALSGNGTIIDKSKVNITGANVSIAYLNDSGAVSSATLKNYTLKISVRWASKGILRFSSRFNFGNGINNYDVTAHLDTIASTISQSEE
ncbi:hypothetical protein [Lactobacillus terrae]|uniref:hypothetical protein n=1 Tax=Lactobacillus terrae TaxID=2269374 RepID=UPI000C1B6997|nr:hypothetical protein [Lactobacillus terrae]